MLRYDTQHLHFNLQHTSLRVPRKKVIYRYWSIFKNPISIDRCIKQNALSIPDFFFLKTTCHFMPMPIEKAVTSHSKFEQQLRIEINKATVTRALPPFYNYYILFLNCFFYSTRIPLHVHGTKTMSPRIPNGSIRPCVVLNWIRVHNNKLSVSTQL